MIKKIAIPLVVLALLVGGYFFFRTQDTEESNDITAQVKRENLKIDVTVSGELEAKNSVDIMGPSGLMSARVYRVKIDDIVPEGKVVREGRVCSVFRPLGVAGKG